MSAEKPPNAKVDIKRFRELLEGANYPKRLVRKMTSHFAALSELNDDEEDAAAVLASIKSLIEKMKP